MDYEPICCSLQTISMARLFYEYGKLDRLLERGITISSDDLYEIYYELLIACHGLYGSKIRRVLRMRSLVFQLSQHDAVLPADSGIRESSQHETFGKPVYPKSRKNAFCRVLSMLPGRRHELELSEKDRRRMVERSRCRNRRLLSLRSRTAGSIAFHRRMVHGRSAKAESFTQKERTKRYVPELEAA